MANNIELALKYLPLLDEVYKTSSLTSIMDNTAIKILDGNAVKVFMIEMQGLGNYDRNNGFINGDVNGTWQTLLLEIDRGRSFQVDRMDNEETLDQAFGRLVGEFIRTQVVPETDAYRFAKYANASGVLQATAGTLSANDIVPAIDAASAEMDDNEVPMEGRILFLTPTNYNYIKQSGAISRFATMTDSRLNREFEVFDRMRVIRVPQSRFYTEIELLDGKTSGEENGGYAKAAAGADINFMIIHPTAVTQVKKHVVPRIFSPDENQQADAWKFDYRFYHDAFVYENKTKGIYVHPKA